MDRTLSFYLSGKADGRSELGQEILAVIANHGEKTVMTAIVDLCKKATQDFIDNELKS